MREKTVVVTGANSGIGKETARALGAMGANLVMVCRDRRRAEEAARDVRETATGRVDIVLADLSSQRSIREAAHTMLGRYPRIDVLVSNAGVFRLRPSVTEDGIETVFAVNHLAPFLLANLLMDRLKASAPSRVVVVASAAHHRQALDFDDLDSQGSFRGWRAYGRSKLGNVMFTAALARRLTGTGVNANCLHPGFVVTNLGSGNRVPAKPFWLLARAFARSPAQGADTAVWLAADPAAGAENGGYFMDRRRRRPSDAAQDEAAQERLWKASARLTRLP